MLKVTQPLSVRFTFLVSPVSAPSQVTQTGSPGSVRCKASSCRGGHPARDGSPLSGSGKHSRRRQKLRPTSFCPATSLGEPLSIQTPEPQLVPVQGPISSPMMKKPPSLACCAPWVRLEVRIPGKSWEKTSCRICKQITPESGAVSSLVVSTSGCILRKRKKNSSDSQRGKN